MRLFLGPHAALFAHLGSIDAQRLGERRAELGRLNEQGRESPDFVDSGAVGHAPERVLAAPPGAKLEHHGAILLGEQRVRRGHFHADPGESGFEAKTRLDADEHQVERIRECIHDLALAAIGLGPDEDARSIESQDRRDDEQQIELEDARSSSAGPQENQHEHRQRHDRDQPHKRVDPRRDRRGISGRGELPPQGFILGIDEREAGPLDRIDELEPGALRIAAAQRTGVHDRKIAGRRCIGEAMPGGVTRRHRRCREIDQGGDRDEQAEKRRAFQDRICGDDLEHLVTPSGRPCAGS